MHLSLARSIQDLSLKTTASREQQRHMTTANRIQARRQNGRVLNANHMYMQLLTRQLFVLQLMMSMCMLFLHCIPVNFHLQTKSITHLRLVCLESPATAPGTQATTRSSLPSRNTSRFDCFKYQSVNLLQSRLKFMLSERSNQYFCFPLKRRHTSEPPSLAFRLP